MSETRKRSTTSLTLKHGVEAVEAFERWHQAAHTVWLRSELRASELRLLAAREVLRQVSDMLAREQIAEDVLSSLRADTDSSPGRRQALAECERAASVLRAARVACEVALEAPRSAFEEEPVWP